MSKQLRTSVKLPNKILTNKPLTQKERGHINKTRNEVLSQMKMTIDTHKILHGVGRLVQKTVKPVGNNIKRFYKKSVADFKEGYNQEKK